MSESETMGASVRLETDACLLVSDEKLCVIDQNQASSRSVHLHPSHPIRLARKTSVGLLLTSFSSSRDSRLTHSRLARSFTRGVFQSRVKARSNRSLSSNKLKRIIG